MRVFTGGWDGNSLPEGTAAPPDRKKRGEFLEPETVEGIPVQRVHMQSAGRRWRHITFARGLARYCRNGRTPDVIQLLDLSGWSLPWLLKVRRLGVPLIYTHTMIPKPSETVSRLKGFHHRRAKDCMDCIVVSTGVMRDSLRERGFQGRVEVIPNGLDLTRFRPLGSESKMKAARKQLGLDTEAELIVFVGGFLNERKGLDVLADAWQILARTRPRANLVLVGPRFNRLRGKEEQIAFADRVQTSLDASGARDRVVFTGSVSNVENYLQVADVFVFPSRREGMPNVVPEAFGCGAPSVLADFLGLSSEFGVPGREYVLAERTPEAFADAISSLLDDRARRQALSEQGRDWVERELNVEDSLDRYVELYRELTHPRNSGR